jgi:hypothetical protein
MKPSVLALLVLCLGAAPVGAQQVYSWTDANGVKHFSDMPPPANTTAAKKLHVHSGVTSAEPEAPTQQAPGKEGPKLAAAAGYSPEDIKRNCEVARKNVEIYSASKPNADAEPETQVRYQEGLNKAQDQIKLFCG